MFFIKTTTYVHEKKVLQKPFYMYFVGLIMGSCFIPSPAHALAVSADTGNFYPGVGYGAQVLDMVLEAWKNPDPTATGTTSITLRIAKDGRPFSCETRRFSSSKITDASLCDTAAKIAQFPEPFGTQNSEIILTFVHEQKTNSTAIDNKNSDVNNTDPAGAENTVGAGQGLESSGNANQIGTGTAVQQQGNQSSAVGTAPMDQNSNAPLRDTSGIATDTKSSPVANNSLPSVGSTLIAPSTNAQTQASVPSTTETPVSTLTDSKKEDSSAQSSNNMIRADEAMQKYSQDIFNQARALLEIPLLPDGTYKAVMRVDIAPEGSAKNIAVQTSSGKPEMDNEILRVLRNEVNYPPTPYNDPQSIWLTFTVRK